MALSLCLVGGMGWLHFVFGWKDEHHLTFCSVTSRFVGPTCHTPASSSPTCSPPCSLSAPACRRRKLHNPPRRCPPSARALRARHAAPPPAASAAHCCCRGLCTLPCDAGAPPPRRDPLGPAFRLRVVLHAGPSSAPAGARPPRHAPRRLELGRRRSSASTPSAALVPGSAAAGVPSPTCSGFARGGRARGGRAAGEGPPPECRLPASAPSSARCGFTSSGWARGGPCSGRGCCRSTICPAPCPAPPAPGERRPGGGQPVQWVRGCAAARAGSADRRGRRRGQRG